jgi:hypothetical protein
MHSDWQAKDEVNMADQFERVELEGGHTFRIRSFDDMFRKLHREMDRFRKSEGNRSDSMDHAINFCVTAWHMTDWVWDRYCNYLRYNSMGSKKSSFQLCIREKNAAMGVCDIIANAAKHGGKADTKEARPSVETLLVADPRPEGMSEIEFITTNRERPIELYVVVNGRQQRMYQVLYQAKEFWWNFKQAHLLHENTNEEFTLLPVV